MCYNCNYNNFTSMFLNLFVTSCNLGKKSACQDFHQSWVLAVFRFKGPLPISIKKQKCPALLSYVNVNVKELNICIEFAKGKLLVPAEHCEDPCV